MYNPFDLLLLRRRGFEAHWFETGTPAFLVDTLFERRVSTVSLDRMVGTGDLLSAFDVGRIGTEALLFQTGYLTITGEERLGEEALFRLGYPNRDVRQSLNLGAAAALGAGCRAPDGEQHPPGAPALRRTSAPGCRSYDIANYEGYYASVFYSYFAALGYETVVEESSGHGPLDMTVRTGGHVYLFEFKVVEMTPPGSALAQLRDRG